MRLHLYLPDFEFHEHDKMKNRFNESEKLFHFFFINQMTIFFQTTIETVNLISNHVYVQIFKLQSPVP